MKVERREGVLILKGTHKELVCSKCGTDKIKYFDEYYQKPYCLDCLLTLKYPIFGDNENTAFLIHKKEVITDGN